VTKEAGVSECRPHDVIAEAIASTSKDIDDNGAMCTGWVLIAEWTDAEGAYWLRRLSDETSPSWRTKGLLHDALYDWQKASDDE
jgi:hypothetical protein